MTSAANNGDDDDFDEAGEDERLSAEELCALIGRSVVSKKLPF
jgi:hypothetical protein